MRKITVALIALMAGLNASAQTFVAQVSGVDEVGLIPSSVTADGKPRMELFGYDYNTGEVCTMIYKEGFELDRRVKFHKKGLVSDIWINEAREGGYVETPEGTMYKYDGDWVVEYADTSYVQPVSIAIYNVDKEDCLDGEDVSYTQTLFNQDDKYEYLVPKYRLEERIINEEDRDGDGDIDFRTRSTGSVRTGYDVISEDGSLITSLEIDELEDAYDPERMDLYLWGGKKYIIVTCEDETVIYELDSQTSKVSKVVAESGLRLFPSIAKRNTTVSVEVAAETQKQGGLLQVLSSNGRCVYSRSVDAGIETLQIPTRRLESGVYVVTFKAQGKEVETSKLIIR